MCFRKSRASDPQGTGSAAGLRSAPWPASTASMFLALLLQSDGASWKPPPAYEESFDLARPGVRQLSRWHENGGCIQGRGHCPTRPIPSAARLWITAYAHGTSGISPGSRNWLSVARRNILTRLEEQKESTAMADVPAAWHWVDAGTRRCSKCDGSGEIERGLIAREFFGPGKKRCPNCRGEGTVGVRRTCCLRSSPCSAHRP
jgi:hypothetical protein